MSETAQKRTAGRLAVDGAYIIIASPGRTPQRVAIGGWTATEALGNAGHVGACWNAVEEHAGGKPENVAALVEALETLLATSTPAYDAILEVQSALADYRDGRQYSHPKHGELSLEEVKYCVVDPACGNDDIPADSDEQAAPAKAIEAARAVLARCRCKVPA